MITGGGDVASIHTLSKSITSFDAPVKRPETVAVIVFPASADVHANLFTQATVDLPRYGLLQAKQGVCKLPYFPFRET